MTASSNTTAPCSDAPMTALKCPLGMRLRVTNVTSREPAAGRSIVQSVVSAKRTTQSSGTVTKLEGAIEK